MKLSQFLACAGIVLVGALVFTSEARRYNPAPQSAGYPNNGRYQSSSDSYAPSSYSNGYSSDTSSRSRSPYGPYHSYAVRPAIYGGYGLYHYKGYARHYPAPPAYQKPHYRQVRSYGQNAGGYSKGLKPVAAILMAPAYHASRPSYAASRPSYPASRPSYPASKPSYPASKPSYPASKPSYPASRPSYPANSGRYNQASGQNYRQKRGYNNAGYSNGGQSSNYRTSSSYNSAYGPSQTRYNTRGHSQASSSYGAPATRY